MMRCIVYIFPGDVSAQCVINIKTVLCPAQLKAYVINILQTVC